MPTTVRLSSSTPTSRVVSIALLAVGLVVAVIGTIFVVTSQKDYSAYTARATATITDVRVTTNGSGTQRTTQRNYWVDFDVDGRALTHRPLQGVTSGNLHQGASVELAFPPGHPEKAVTVTTTDPTTERIFLLIGSGLLVLATGLLTTALVVTVRRRSLAARRASAKADLPAPAPAPTATPTAAAVDPALLPVPWPWEQVVAHLARAGADAPFAVTPLPDGGVDVTYDVADARWFTLLRAHGLTETLVCRLEPKHPGRYARRDTLHEVEWGAGVGALSASGRVVQGRVWSAQRRVDIGVGSDGTVGRQVDVTFSSRDVPRWVDSVLAGSGWSSALDANATGGLIAAGIGLGVAFLAVVLALVITLASH
ncbi:DUF3592 domain-containing protein [Luteimicrobium subarcticum]|uniref:DUF3592 domain-containing protein n=1 Tax=Luteimicrobium subarcticum TaxID=620910 RepID=A0A2M8WUR7_9MICO|nr:DUF3592 domain-containing protein [Luteimicrobium subarcticum]PJI94648.1 hypothetical protein CLV34_0493 [Luteimicrobium subarcticum]